MLISDAGSGYMAGSSQYVIRMTAMLHGVWNYAVAPGAAGGALLRCQIGSAHKARHVTVNAATLAAAYPSVP